MSSMPVTTLGFSVKRSSRPEKSPYVEDSPAYVESPRLWYSVVSLSQAGTLTSLSASATFGTYGKDVPAVIFGKQSGTVSPAQAGLPATAASSKALPRASL